MSRNTPCPTTASSLPPDTACSSSPALPVWKGDASMTPPLPFLSSRVEHRPPMKQEQSLVGHIFVWLRTAKSHLKV
ncbi:hypothetical protein LA080_004945 [Diaporthe eres]|nr:hypothetical protein LA080_004945 [Diaporthe eres]